MKHFHIGRAWHEFLHGGQRKEETEFLPALLEVTETPPSPVGRAVLWSIIALLVCGFLWAFFGHVNETAVAEGKVVPSGQVKTVQVKNKGIVREIDVKEGQLVHEGDTLVLLDPTSTDADTASLRKRAAYYALDIARLEAELADKPFTPPDDVREDLDAHDLEAEQQLYNSRQGHYRAEREAAQAAVEQKRAGIEAVQANYDQYRKMLAVAQEKESRLERLVEENAIAEFQLLEQRSQRIDLQRTVEVQQKSLQESQAEEAEAEKKLRSVEEDYRKDVMTSLVDSRKQYYALQEEIKKAAEDADLTTVVAPCDGWVYNLAVHTEGAVVTDAQPIMMIVPSDAELEFEVWADNKDIGFLHEGQEAEVKVQTFDFQKFGVVKAVLEDISPDAASDERDPRTYEKYRLVLKQESSGSTGIFQKDSPFTPGMNVTAEIKIREKRILDFFLDPFRRYTSESLRER
jgi:HlyD family type I secretion membrane fusion protein